MTETRTPGLPVVAVVGRPNVGKSSLINRILGRREAIVQETPGVTRDRRGFTAEWRGRSFELVDTGGLEPGATGLEARVAEQAQIAIEAADVTLLVVDAIVGPSQDDHEVAELLRKAGKPVIIVANKVDSARDEPGAAEFYRLGLGDPVPVSALHGRGSGDLLDEVVARLPETEPEPDGTWAAIALVGRPNVGKSSILNRLLGHDRSLVDERPGTTRDPIDDRLELADGRVLTVIDTAGMRRQTHINDEIEYYGFLRSRKTLERADAVVLVIDASEGVTGLDQRIAERIVEAGRACVLVLNKWDLVTNEPTDRARAERAIEDALRFLPWATVLRTSALTGRGMDRILAAVTEALVAHRYRVETSTLNRILRSAQEKRPPARARGKVVRILYGVQASVAPPEVVVFVTGQLDTAYVRYLEREVRATQPFEGTPIRVVVRRRTRPEP
jgi:GTPase